jgi:hypothetical protein
MPIRLRKPWVKVEKARGVVPANAQDVSAMVQAITRMANKKSGYLDSDDAVLQRPPEWMTAQFGPLWPIPPQYLDAPEEATGLPQPRIWEYPVAWNLPGQQMRRHVSWQVLKDAGESPLFRACIEIRKQRISTLDWAFTIDPTIAAREATQSGTSQKLVEVELKKRFQSDIDRLTEFWSYPDRKNELNFADWISQVLEEQLVTDALSIWPNWIRSGQVCGYTVIDGSTIKPLLDEHGGRPMPPYPAFQQILYGFPRGEFVADTVEIDGQKVIPGALSQAQFVYRRRVIRPWTPYGFSPTEQALLDGMLWSKRFQWMVAEYTEGAQPLQYLVNKGQTGWEPRQLLEYERALNDRLSGKTAQRYRAPLLPEGIEPMRGTEANERYKPEYDLFLIKLSAMHFGVTMPELGFAEGGQLGSAGYHEGEEDVQARKDLATVRWLNNFITELSRKHLNCPAEVVFRFLGLEEEDEASADQVAENQVRTGRKTINQDCVDRGLPPFDFKEANMPMLMTERGVVFLEGSSDAAPPGVLIEPAELNIPGADSGPPTGPAGGQTQGVTPRGGGPKPGRAPARPVKRSPTAAQAAKELEQYARWLQNPANDGGTFEFHYLDGDKVGKAASDGDPKDGQAGELISSWLRNIYQS